MACCRWATVLPTTHLSFSLILNPLNQLEHLAPTHVMTVVSFWAYMHDIQQYDIFRAGTLFLLAQSRHSVQHNSERKKSDVRKGRIWQSPFQTSGRGMTIRDSFPSLVRERRAEKITQFWIQINSHGPCGSLPCWIINLDPGSRYFECKRFYTFL